MLVSDQVPVFNIYKLGQEKVQVDTLKHCFIERRVLDFSNPPPVLTTANGAVYVAVYDLIIHSPLAGPISCIISFQSHDYGMFAVIRIITPTEQIKQL